MRELEQEVLVVNEPAKLAVGELEDVRRGQRSGRKQQLAVRIDDGELVLRAGERETQAFSHSCRDHAMLEQLCEERIVEDAQRAGRRGGLPVGREGERARAVAAHDLEHAERARV
ncbi:MAG: hypothetical protein Q8O67_11190 [Deltaproteobacteria bacterium]|nr:hypothetical protein [Deltaproteobacteria bacterium]